MEVKKIYGEEKVAIVILGWEAMALVLMCLFATPPVSADVLVYGSYSNYSESVLPNTSYVHQGESIYQGGYYDLGGVYGFSGKLGWWEDSTEAGIGTPDKIVNLGDLDPHKLTYIDPEKFPLGPLYQYDGYYCQEDSYCTSGFGSGNAFAFAVVPKPDEYITENRTVISYKNITSVDEYGNISTIVVEVAETLHERRLVPSNKQDVLAKNVTTLVVPTNAPNMITAEQTPRQTLLLPGSDHTPVPTTIEVVTPKSAPDYIPILAIISLALVALWRRE